MAGKKNRYEVVQIATQTEAVILDNEDLDEKNNPKQVDLYSAVAEILSEVKEIKKSIKG